MIIPNLIIVCQSCGFVYNRIINTQKCKISYTGDHHWKKFNKSEFRILDPDFLTNEADRYGMDNKEIE